MPLILPSNSISAVGYEVDNSLRFDDGSSDYLSRTFSSGNQQIWTFSAWVKFSDDDNLNYIFSTGADAENRLVLLRHNSATGSTLKVDGKTATTQTIEVRTNRAFRDLSSFYHIVLSVDTTQATSSDRVKIFVNGEQETSFAQSTYPSQNYNTEVNKASAHYIGKVNIGTTYYNGYLAETVFIDGQALDPTSFGEFDADTGIWKPIDVSGLTFGTNGFYLPFENSGALGQDDSGNGNNFTVNNLTSIDQTTDTPTNNFATLNPITGNTNPTFSNGNCSVQGTLAGNVPATIGVSSGKWYWEQKVTSSNAYVAICNDSGYNATVSVSGSGSGAVGYFGSGEIFDEGGSAISSLTTFTTNDIIGVHLNMDDGNITWYKNGSIVSGSTYTFGTTGNGTLFENAFPCFNVGGATTRSSDFNFGNPVHSISSGNSDGAGFGQFEYAPPSGYLALCTKNLATDG